MTKIDPKRLNAEQYISEAESIMPTWNDSAALRLDPAVQAAVANAYASLAIARALVVLEATLNELPFRIGRTD